MATENIQLAQPPPASPGQKKIAPYWYLYTMMAKGRWLGHEILKMVLTEFQDQSMEYYVHSFVLHLIILLLSTCTFVLIADNRDIPLSQV
jgi:hypothetical protein